MSAAQRTLVRNAGKRPGLGLQPLWWIDPDNLPQAKMIASAGSPTRTPRRVWLGLVLMVVLVGSTLVLLAPGQLPPNAWWRRQVPVSPAPLASFPPIMLWAWERPELLGFIDPNAVGVAFLARTLYLSGPDVLIRPRLQPLRVPPGTKLMAVMRIEVDRLRPPELSTQQRQLAASALADRRDFPDVAALQIDFDAAVSQRLFYGDLLHDLRHQLSTEMALSMTALASWCIYDDWLAGMPVDEVVPMVFRMGADQQRVRRYLDAEDFRAERCRQSLGVSTDEPLPTRRPLRRLYMFHPHPWRPEALARLLEEVGRWPPQP